MWMDLCKRLQIEKGHKPTPEQQYSMDQITAVLYEIKRNAEQGKGLSDITNKQLMYVLYHAAYLLGFTYQTAEKKAWYEPPKDGIDFGKVARILDGYRADPERIANMISQEEV